MQSRVLLCVIVLAAFTGCRDRSVPTAPPAPPAPAPEPPAPASPVPEPPRQPFDETKGYLHKPSGVGFIFPDGWKKSGTRSEGPVTSLGLNRDNPYLTVTLYWTEPDAPIDPATVGQAEFDGLTSLYGAKIGQPEAIQVGGQKGFKLLVNSGPLGTTASDTTGVVYVFAVRRNERTWKIKLRATVPGREQLATIEPLLQNFRW